MFDRDAIIQRLDDCAVAANVRFDGLHRSMARVRSTAVKGRDLQYFLFIAMTETRITKEI